MAQLGSTQQAVVNFIQRRSWVSAINTGIGLAYAVDNNTKIHFPLVWFFPSLYVGYNGYFIVKERLSKS